MSDELQLKIAIEKERRRRQALRDAELQQPDEGRSFGEMLVDAPSQINYGLMSFLPKSWLEKIHETTGGIAHPDYNPDAFSAGMRGVGMASPLVAAAPAVAAKGAQTALNQSPTVVQGLSKDILKTANEMPARFYGAEGLAAFGAAAMSDMAQKNEDAGPVATTMAELTGGLLGGLFAQTIPTGLRNARDAVMANIFPMTEAGGKIRAARQMQARAGGRNEEYAKMLEDRPSGISPARWIGDQRLMAQEARLLADNPDLDNLLKAEMEVAEKELRRSLTDDFGNPLSRADWERKVLNRVTPDSAKITGSQTDELLESAYQSFKPLYDTAKGQNINASKLEEGALDAVMDSSIIAKDSERMPIVKFLQGEIRAYTGKIDENGYIKSDHLLDLRHRIRDERRKQLKGGYLRDAELLGAAEAEITGRLENGLSNEAVKSLVEADSQYRLYKVVENAVYKAGDDQLTPQGLSAAIRGGNLTSSGRYARGQDQTVQDLRNLALQGRDTSDLVQNPRAAERRVRGIDPEGLEAVQADFVKTLSSNSRDAKDLIKQINQNKEVFDAIGFEKESLDRLKNIARGLEALERKPQAAVEHLFEDGPTRILELIFTLGGAKTGQRVSGGGLGSGLVMAQYLANSSRQTLANLTADEAQRLMIDSVMNPVLYKALLTKNVTKSNAQREAGQALDAWLMNAAYDRMVEAQREEELPTLPEEFTVNQ
jgi:hypothetical protein